jgi:hypothetical protein
MKSNKIVKNLAKKISTQENCEYETLFFDAESLVRIAIQEYGFRNVKKLTVGELVLGVEKNIPPSLIKSKKIHILKNA